MYYWHNTNVTICEFSPVHHHNRQFQNQKIHSKVLLCISQVVLKQSFLFRVRLKCGLICFPEICSLQVHLLISHPENQPGTIIFMYFERTQPHEIDAEGGSSSSFKEKERSGIKYLAYLLINTATLYVLLIAHLFTK